MPVFIFLKYIFCVIQNRRELTNQIYLNEGTPLWWIFNLGFSFTGYWLDKVDVICFLPRNYNRDSKKDLIDLCWSIVRNEQNFTKGNNSTKEIKIISEQGRTRALCVSSIRRLCSMFCVMLGMWILDTLLSLEMLGIHALSTSYVLYLSC